MSKIRCFIGIYLPEEVKNEVVRLQKSIERLPASCKMVERENLHICLSFLGEVEDGDAQAILKKLEAICSNHCKFEVEIDGIRLIPGPSYVRVVVLDSVDKSGALESIRNEIKTCIGGDSKPPHITLCRVRDVSDKQKFVDGAMKLDGRVPDFIVESIAFIESKLGPRGPVYSSLGDSKLR